MRSTVGWKQLNMSEQSPHPENRVYLGGPIPDREIKRRLALSADDPERLVVTPIVDPGQIGSTTIDVRLGTRWQTLNSALFQSLDPRRPPERLEHLLQTASNEFLLTAGMPEDIVLHPGQLILVLTLEYLHLPTDLWAELDGRSTYARVGLQTHATAGMIDPGFQGFLTFELQNTGTVPLSLFPGQRVGQLAFFHVQGVENPYGEKRGAAYSEQYSVGTAYARQREHEALYRYHERETKALARDEEASEPEK